MTANSSDANSSGTDSGGTVAVVTGATAGLGKEIARGLVRRGATVIIGARDAQRGAAAREQLAADAALGGTVTVLPLDVADQASIRTFAADVADRHAALDLLVNNAGAWFTDRRETADGVELTFATNVIGPYLLTNLLEARLRQADAARVVNVVSSIVGDYDVDDLQFVSRPYDGFKSYSQSKQALRMLTWGAAARFAGSTGVGSAVTVNAAAPGFVRTEFNRNAHGARAAMINLSARLFAASPAKGADTPLWVATAPELHDVSGAYFTGRSRKDGGFSDVEAIAELERRCDELTKAVHGG